MTSFQPPQRVLLGPGPTNVHPRVLGALARPTVGHLDPAFTGLMTEVKALLRYAFQTTNDVTFPLSGPGSAGMEACFVNLVEPGDTVIVCQNGVFGERMTEIARRVGARPVVIQDAWGDPVDPNKVASALKANPGAAAVAFVHAETSTGALSDAAAICDLARRHGALTIVDTVTSLGGAPVLLDDWGADAAYSGSQKCLSCVPGLSPVSFGPRALGRIRARRHPVQSWFLDLDLITRCCGDNTARAYHHTAPVNSVYALHEALLMLREEGLVAAWARHAINQQALIAGLEAMGLGLLGPAEARLPQLTAILCPPGVDEAEVRQRLLTRHGLEIGAGLGVLAGKIWRIGLMGHGSTADNVMHLLSTLEETLAWLDAPIRPHAATAAAGAVLGRIPSAAVQENEAVRLSA